MEPLIMSIFSYRMVGQVAMLEDVEADLLH
jgi:hypothetical protein